MISSLPARFVFWQPMPSMHQVPFLEALAMASRAEVIAAYAERLAADRFAQGWRPASSSAVREVYEGDPAWEQLVADEATTTLHVFSGFRCHPSVRSALRSVASGSAAFGVISEAHDGRGLRGMVRWGRSAYDAALYGRRASFVLAMGRLGVSWFRGAGFPAGRVHPFAYVTPTHPVVPSHGDGGGVIYVGQLIHRKGVDLLLEAVAKLSPSVIPLTIVGTGPDEASLRARAGRLGIAHAVSWAGVVPNESIHGLMALHEALVLPSRFDGWGAVVNEALSAGTPVLCSTTCGAADLLEDRDCGEVFQSGDTKALAASIRRIVGGEAVGAARRQRIIARSRSFSADAVARYFQDVLASAIQSLEPPPPPWRTVPLPPHV